MDFTPFGLKPDLTAKILGWVLFGLTAAESAVTIYHEKFKSPFSRKAFFTVILFTPLVAFLSLEANSVKDELADKEKRASEERIKTLESDTVRSTYGIAKAKLETEAIKKSTMNVQSKMEEASLAAAVEKQKVATMMVEVAEAKQKQFEAEKALLLLRNSIRPRSLSADQKELLIKLLKKHTGTPEKFYVDLVCTIGDEEACAYADEIKAVLDAAGWVTHEPARAQFVDLPVFGLVLQISNKKYQPRHAAILQRTFSQIDVPVKGQIDPSMPIGEVRLIVGRKDNH